MMKRLGLLADNEHRLPMVPATPELAGEARRRARARRAAAALAKRAAAADLAVGDCTSRASTSRASEAPDDGIVDFGRLLGAQYRRSAPCCARGELHACAISLGAREPTIALEEIRYLPTVPDPEKIICIGINYGNRNEEYKDGAESRRSIRACSCARRAASSVMSSRSRSAGVRPARLRGRDRARDRQGGPPHRRARTRGVTSRGCRS